MHSLPIPEGGKAFTVEWVRQALNAGGDGGFPAIKDIAVEDIGADSGALGVIVRCTITYRDAAAQAPESVVIKLSSSDKKSLRIAKMLSMYQQEFCCFRQLAPHIQIGLPASEFPVLRF